MQRIKFLFVGIVLLYWSCDTDDVEMVVSIATLAEVVQANEVLIDNVIACASGSQIENEIIAYFYPRPGSSDFQYYETENTLVDKNDYENYSLINLPTQDLFNGVLKKFTRQTDVEKWVIISFRESGILHLSNPIRLKHKTQNTTLGNAVTITQDDSQSPVFNWDAITSDNDAIYFQVLSETNSDFISGTYTFESQFQFYNLDNVVLNITNGTPEPLIVNEAYRFTLMAVSEDNWVNYLALEIPFIAQ